MWWGKKIVAEERNIKWLSRSWIGRLRDLSLFDRLMMYL